MDVEALGLETGKAIRDGLEPLTDGIEMIESFLQAEVAQVVGTDFVAQEAENFSYCLRNAFFLENVQSVFRSAAQRQ